MNPEERINQWERADRLAALDPAEYEKQLPALIKETGLTRQQLTAIRMTALRWPKERRLEGVPFAVHRRYRYEPEELERQHKTGTLTKMAASISAVLVLAETPNVTNAEFRKQVRAILGQWERETTAEDAR